MINKYKLYTVIESDNNIGHVSQWYNDAHKKISYEAEAILCFTSWRKSFNHLNDIEIICINPTKYDISKKTKKMFDCLNITYIFKHFPICDEYKCRWYNVPYLGMWLENTLNDNDVLIHIDLDMILLKDPSDRLLNVKGHLALVGAYDFDNMYDKRSHDHKFYNNAYDQLNVTCWIISRVCDKFYTLWYYKLLHTSELISDIDHWREYCDLEEHVVDILKYEDDYDIKYINEFMIGPGYTILDKIKNDKTLFEKMTFLHAHEFQSRSQYLHDYMQLKCSL